MKDGLYHREVGFPPNFSPARAFTGKINLEYSRHAMKAAVTDRYYALHHPKWPFTIEANPEHLIEILVENGAVTKGVFRIPYNDKLDLVFEINPANWRGASFVRTVWINLRDDPHATLDASKYTRP